MFTWYQVPTHKRILNEQLIFLSKQIPGGRTGPLLKKDEVAFPLGKILDFLLAYTSVNSILCGQLNFGDA